MASGLLGRTLTGLLSQRPDGHWARDSPGPWGLSFIRSVSVFRPGWHLGSAHKSGSMFTDRRGQGASDGSKHKRASFAAELLRLATLAGLLADLATWWGKLGQGLGQGCDDESMG